MPADAQGPRAAEGFHPRLFRIAAGALDASTAQTPGMVRAEAISARSVGSRDLWMGETTVHPATASGDHHHGRSETGIYVVSGHPAFVFVEEGRLRRLETGPGDYVYVPPWVPHREENPDPEVPAVVVIARTTQEAIVVNLAGLEAVGAAGEGDPR